MALSDGIFPEMPPTLSIYISNIPPKNTMAQFQNIHATYVKVANGLFLTKCPQEKSNYEAVHQLTGQKYYYFGTNGFTGTIHDITIEDSEYGRQYTFHIIDENGEPFKMVLKYGSGLAQGFLNTLAAVAAENKSIGWLKMTASVKRKDDKSYTSIWIQKSSRESYRWKYSLEEIPPVVKTKNKRTGKEEVDDEERLEFFDKVLDEEIRPALKSLPSAEATLGLGEPAPLGETDEDDLHF
jgi:hypothetical protein